MARNFDATDVMKRVLADTGLSIAEFAFHAGKHPATIERWCNGRTTPGERTVAAALLAVGISPGEYGVHEPATRIQPLNTPAATTQPEWAVRMEKKLDEMLRLSRGDS